MTPPETASFDALLWSLAEQEAPSRALRDIVAEVAATEAAPQLTVVTVIADQADPLERLRRASGATTTDTARLGEVGLLRVRDSAGEYVLSIWPTREPGVFHLVGTEPVTDERWRRIERWIANSAPRIAAFFLNEADFAGIGAALAEFGRVEVSRMSARKLGDNSSYTRGWSGERRNPRPTYAQALSEADEVRAAVRTLTLHVADMLSVHLRRRAGATFYAGNFTLFEDVVLARLADAGAGRKQLLSGRQRTEPRIDRAIALRLSDGLFGDPDAISELLYTLVDQRGAGVAVLHRNPYLHVALTDYLDGSNFDVFVTSDDEFVIYPGYRASLGSLTRLTDHVGERFAAREVVDVPAARPPSREELFTTG